MMALTASHVGVAQALITSRKTKIELDPYAETYVVTDDCQKIHDHNMPVNIYNADPKDGHKSAQIVAQCFMTIHTMD